MNNEVSEVVISVLTKAERLLLSVGVKYQIRYPDGTLHGNMPQTPEQPNRKRRKRSHYPLGHLTKHILNHMKIDTPVGVVMSIPVSVYGFDAIQSCASSLAGVHWGKGSYTSYRNKQSQSIEILRHG
jgi:hypothetical protein